MDYLSDKEKEDMTLLELLDRLLDKGIVLYGDLIISIAEIDLIYVGLTLVISSVDTIMKNREEYD